MELVVLHNYCGAPGLVRGGPAEIKSPCLDVSQDRATKRPAPRHTNAFYWTEKYMLEIREIHVHGVPH